MYNNYKNTKIKSNINNKVVIKSIKYKINIMILCKINNKNIYKSNIN